MMMTEVREREEMREKRMRMKKKDEKMEVA